MVEHISITLHEQNNLPHETKNGRIHTHTHLHRNTDLYLMFVTFFIDFVSFADSCVCVC